MTYKINGLTAHKLQPHTFYQFDKDYDFDWDKNGNYTCLLRDAKNPEVLYKSTPKINRYIDNTEGARDCDGNAHITVLTHGYKTFKNSSGKTITYLDLECHDFKWQPRHSELDINSMRLTFNTHKA